MSDKNEHPNKKTKLDVFNDQSNHVKVKNVPVVFNDYGSQCNNTCDTVEISDFLFEKYDIVLLF